MERKLFFLIGTLWFKSSQCNGEITDNSGGIVNDVVTTPTYPNPTLTPKETDLEVIKNMCMLMLANFMFYSCRLIHICHCLGGLKGICLCY